MEPTVSTPARPRRPETGAGGGAPADPAPRTEAAGRGGGAPGRGEGTAGRGARRAAAGDEALSGARAAWREAAAATPERPVAFSTISGLDVEPVYGPGDVETDYLRDLGFPGAYPFTRGPYASMYRSRLWTMRQFAGFGSAADTNARYRFLLDHGQTGLSVAFDMPTLMGYDSDHELAEGEVGICGVAVASLQDMERLFQDIPLDRVSTSMTINGPAVVLFAFYLAVAERQGVSFDRLRGTLQTDILKEYIAQKEWIFPPAPHLRIIVDMMRFCAERTPLWHPISVSGYHIREAGSTAGQELAFTLANGFTYVEEGIRAGLRVDDFAPRLSFFFNAHNEFFEEIAKYRAARRIWARRMRERYGAKDERSLRLRFHTQTAGVSLTEQQPENNIVRVALQAMAAVLGGTQSLHTNSMDETIALPSEKAVKIALRTQQILAYETGVANVIDPLAGSYYVEALTDRLEREAEDYFAQIDEMGGVVAGIEAGFFQREIARAAYRYQQEVERRERLVVGVNEFVEEDEQVEIPILRISPEVEARQRERLADLRRTRDAATVETALARLREAVRGTGPIMEPVLDAARAYATLGEIVDVMRAEFGGWREPAGF